MSQILTQNIGNYFDSVTTELSQAFSIKKQPSVSRVCCCSLLNATQILKAFFVQALFVGTKSMHKQHQQMKSQDHPAMSKQIH